MEVEAKKEKKLVLQATLVCNLEKRLKRAVADKKPTAQNPNKLT